MSSPETSDSTCGSRVYTLVSDFSFLEVPTCGEEEHNAMEMQNELVYMDHFPPMPLSYEHYIPEVRQFEAEQQRDYRDAHVQYGSNHNERSGRPGFETWRGDKSQVRGPKREISMGLPESLVLRKLRNSSASPSRRVSYPPPRQNNDGEPGDAFRSLEFLPERTTNESSFGYRHLPSSKNPLADTRNHQSEERHRNHETRGLHQRFSSASQQQRRGQEARGLPQRLYSFPQQRRRILRPVPQQPEIGWSEQNPFRYTPHHSKDPTPQDRDVSRDDFEGENLNTPRRQVSDADLSSLTWESVRIEPARSKQPAEYSSAHYEVVEQSLDPVYPSIPPAPKRRVSAEALGREPSSRRQVPEKALRRQQSENDIGPRVYRMGIPSKYSTVEHNPPTHEQPMVYSRGGTNGLRRQISDNNIIRGEMLNAQYQERLLRRQQSESCIVNGLGFGRLNSTRTSAEYLEHQNDHAQFSTQDSVSHRQRGSFGRERPIQRQMSENKQPSTMGFEGLTRYPTKPSRRHPGDQSDVIETGYSQPRFLRRQVSDGNFSRAQSQRHLDRANYKRELSRRQSENGVALRTRSQNEIPRRQSENEMRSRGYPHSQLGGQQSENDASQTHLFHSEDLIHSRNHPTRSSSTTVNTQQKVEVQEISNESADESCGSFGEEQCTTPLSRKPSLVCPPHALLRQHSDSTLLYSNAATGSARKNNRNLVRHKSEENLMVLEEERRDLTQGVSRGGGVRRQSSMASISEEPKLVRDSIAYRSSCQRQMVNERAYPEKKVEVSPGKFVRLRGAEETWHAIEHGFTLERDCSNCHQEVCFVRDADYFICPDCKCISSVSREHDDIAGGIGLGFNTKLMKIIAERKSNNETNKAELGTRIVI